MGYHIVCSEIDFSGINIFLPSGKGINVYTYCHSISTKPKNQLHQPGGENEKAPK